MSNSLSSYSNYVSTCGCNQREFSDWTRANIFVNVVEFSVIVSLWWREFETCTHICYSTGCMIFQYIKSNWTSNWTELQIIIIIHIKKGLILRYWMTFWWNLCRFFVSLLNLWRYFWSVCFKPNILKNQKSRYRIEPKNLTSCSTTIMPLTFLISS